jgi:DNA repair exonuclease SbcCD ATPase subunit
MRLLLLLALAALLEAPAPAATLADLEQEAVRRAAERDAARSERRRLAAEAAPLADAVARSDDQGPSAGRELTRRLRELDRVAARLDEVERRLREAELRLQRAAAAFEKQAQLEERALLERGRTGGAASVASELAALAEARRRLAAFTGPPHFRRPLVVSLAALEGPAEIAAKLAIIDGERARLAERERELRREESLLAARLRARREWARDLGAARREAAGEIELLERAHESAEGVMRELSEQAAAVAAELTQLRQWDQELARRRREAEERLRSLETRRTTP